MRQHFVWSPFIGWPTSVSGITSTMTEVFTLKIFVHVISLVPPIYIVTFIFLSQFYNEKNKILIGRIQ